MAEPQIVPVAAVTQDLARLDAFLSKADYDRLQALLRLFTPGQAAKVDLARCLNAVSPGRATREQLDDFRAFRQRLRQSVKKAGLALALEVDSKGI